MAARKVDMHRLQEFVRLHRMGCSARQCAKLLGLGRNTIRRYSDHLRTTGLLDGQPEALPSHDQLQQGVAQSQPASARPPQQCSTILAWEGPIQAMLQRGAGPTAIYDALRTQDPTFKGSLGAVKRLCFRLTRAAGPKAHEVAIPVCSAPGDIAQVDFGYLGLIRDPVSLSLRKAWVFVLVLAHSRHTFARIVFDQSAHTWQALHVEAFEYLGGVPATLVPDNLKAAVVRAAFTTDELSGLHRGYLDLARHYGFKVDPAPVRKPENKGKVEAGVKYVKGNFLPPRSFQDLNDANTQLDHWLLEVAGQRRHGTTGLKPAEHFLAEEQQALKPLPPKAFVPATWHHLKVGQDAHILLAGRAFSVPWQLVGQQVWVRASAHALYVFHDHQQVATHPRHGQGHRSTDECHLPPHRVPWRHRSPSHWLQEAESIGPEALAWMRALYDTNPTHQPTKIAVAAVALLRTVSPKRANAACQRAHEHGAYTATSLKRILAAGLEAVQSTPDTSTPFSFLAALPRFARQDLAAQLREQVAQ